MKTKLLFVITQFYKGGAEVALLNLFQNLDKEEFEVDFLIFDQMPLANGTSLISEIPNWIHVCNASKQEGNLAVIKKIWFKAWIKLTKHQLYRASAYQFVKDKLYDVAISYGEWLSPEFIAKKVKAKKKMIWIHTDIDKATYVNEKILFGYDKFYTNYIFVSELSRKSAEKKFPLLIGKSQIVHNICNDKKIKELANQTAPELEQYPKPWLITVGNLREEKNYKRHIEVMKELKNRGILFSWFSIGSTANMFLYQQVKTMIDKYQLNDRCILLGVKENPYCYMSKADAIILLSDFESWSLVITEAKLLNIPVIATSTSGAQEQIINKETGILTSFDVKEIADNIEEYLKNNSIKKYIRRNLKQFLTSKDILKEFKKVIEINR